MRRKTDLFTMEESSKKMINEAVNKHCKLFSEDKAR